MEVKLTLMHVELMLALIHWCLADENHGMDEEMVAAFQQLGTFFAMVSMNPGQFAPSVVVIGTATTRDTLDAYRPTELDVDEWENEGGA